MTTNLPTWATDLPTWAIVLITIWLISSLVMAIMIINEDHPWWRKLLLIVFAPFQLIRWLVVAIWFFITL